MTNRWKLAVLLFVSFSAVPSRARADDPELRQKVEELKRELARQRQLFDGMLALQEMTQRLAALEQRVAALEGRPAQGRTSSYFTPNTGTIRLVNQLSMPATFIVGGEPHRLAAGAQMDLRDQPAGPFFYEVLVDGFGAIQPRVTRTLKPGQLFTIFTHP
jgi:hypothetical protein